ncbi:MAG: chalcone isomerase family protein [Ectothiorhodospiraceae bacterium]
MLRFVQVVMMAGALSAVTAAGAAEEVTTRGVTVPGSVEVADTELSRVGYGTSWYGIFKVYVAALYAPADVEPEAILDSDVPRVLEITYLRSVAAEDIRTATNEVLDEQYSEDERADFADDFERFNQLYRDVEDGDTYRYEYVPEDEESRLYYNGELQGRATGARFARTYLGIWLGEPPLSDDLKAALLGDD